MENLRITFAAGETKVFVKAGRYFEIIESAAAVTVGFYNEAGSQNHDANKVLSGFYLNEKFSQFDITSPTAQTVEIFVSDALAGTRRQPGIVRVVDEVDAICETRSAGIPTAVIPFGVTTIAGSTPAVRNTLRQVSMTITSGAAAQAAVRLVAAENVPASFSGSAKQIVLADLYSADGSVQGFQDSNLKRRLPMGWGIFVVYQIVASASLTGGVVVSVERGAD